ncbi:MAG: hypothetical protein JXQ75_24315 [Phycisphaerae bacterium]|nr:hypothetical protein [Phycisphaerae bacterium]
MSRVHPVFSHPNLPDRQQVTQSLADQFNADERVWADLEPLRRLRRLLRPGVSCRKRKQEDLADFAHARPPKDCVAQWVIE